MPAVTRVQTMTSAANVAASTQGGGVEDSSSCGSTNFMDALDRASQGASSNTSAAQKTSSKSADSNPKPAAVSSKPAKKTKAHSSKAKANDDPAPEAQANAPVKASSSDASSTSQDVTGDADPDSSDQKASATTNEATASDDQSPDVDAQLAAYAAASQTATVQAKQSGATPKKSPASMGLADLHRFDPRFDKVSTNSPLVNADVEKEQETSAAESSDSGVQAQDQSQEAQDDPTDVKQLPDEQVRQPKQTGADVAGQLQAQKQTASAQPRRTGPALGQALQPQAKSDDSETSKTNSLNPFQSAGNQPVPAPDQSTDADAAAAAASVIAAVDSKGRSKSADDATGEKVSSASIAPQVQATKAEHIQTPVAAEKSADARFAEVNHPQIVQVIRGQLLPNGGTLQLRLDPPDLGPLNVTVTMRDGAMSAAFATANEQATRLLSHSLGQLKSVLETAGVTVEKLQVQQAPRSQGGDTSDAQQQQQSHDSQQQQDASSRQEQQRREILERMWEKIQLGADDVDLVG